MDEPKKERWNVRITVLLAIFLVILLIIALWWPRITCDHRDWDKWHLHLCAIKLQGLGKAMEVYTQDYRGYLPTGSQWCDLLILHEDISPSSLHCNKSDARTGECSYAINKYVAGKWIFCLPKQTVLLFETDYGAGIRDENFDYRIPDINITTVNNISVAIRNPKLNKLQWNQVGDVNILYTKYHKKDGCNILFVDGTVEFVKTEDIAKLLWDPEQYDWSIQDLEKALKSKWFNLDSTKKKAFQQSWAELGNYSDKAHLIGIYSEPNLAYENLSALDKEKFSNGFSDANSLKHLTDYPNIFPWIDVNALDLSDKVLIYMCESSKKSINL